ncbi:hypothetical protein [Streptomyces sp. NPDC054784]
MNEETNERPPCDARLDTWTCTLPSGPHRGWRHVDERVGFWWSQAVGPAVEDLLAENARLRTELAALQARYDAAVGLDRPEVAAGAEWQNRRADQPKPTTTCTPSAPLPRRTPTGGPQVAS